MRKALSILILFLGMVLASGSAVASSGCSDTGINSCYHFNESSSPLEDFSGNSYDGTWFGGITSGATGISKNDGDWADGLAYSFDGQDDYVDIPNSAIPLQGNDKTISVWYSTTNGSQKQSKILGGRDSGNGHEFSIFINETYDRGNENIAVAQYDGSEHRLDANINNPFDGTWHNIVYVQNSTGTSLWVDGELKEYLNEDVSVDIQDSNIDIGRKGGDGGQSDYYDGKVDELKVYNEPLSSSEIQNLYDANSRTDTGNSAPSISDFNPADGAIGVNDTDDSTGIDVNISFNVFDSDNSTLSSVDLKWSNGTVINSWSSVSTGNFSHEVENLENGTTYEYFVEASDGISTTTSSNKSFTTATDTVVPSENLLLYNNLDDSSCPPIDLSDYNRTSTCTNSPTPEVPGFDGTAFEFGNSTGDGDYYSIDGSSGDLDFTDSFTVMTWVKLDKSENGTNAPLITKGDTQFSIKHTASNSRFQFLTYDGSYHTTDVELSEIDYSYGDWVHVAGVYNASSSSISIYINGTEKGSTDSAGITSNGYKVALGENLEKPDRDLSGTDLDEVRIYNESLTSSEIQSISTASSSVSKESSLSMYREGSLELIDHGSSKEVANPIIINKTRYLVKTNWDPPGNIEVQKVDENWKNPSTVYTSSRSDVEETYVRYFPSYSKKKFFIIGNIVNNSGEFGFISTYDIESESITDMAVAPNGEPYIIDMAKTQCGEDLYLTPGLSGPYMYRLNQSDVFQPSNWNRIKLTDKLDDQDFNQVESRITAFDCEIYGTSGQGGVRHYVMTKYNPGTGSKTDILNKDYGDGPGNAVAYPRSTHKEYLTWAAPDNDGEYEVLISEDGNTFSNPVNFSRPGDNSGETHFFMYSRKNGRFFASAIQDGGPGWVKTVNNNGRLW